MPQQQSNVRVRVFVDYWNFQLALNRIEDEVNNSTNSRFKVDWKQLGPWMAQKAIDIIKPKPSSYSFEGIIIYTSYNPKTDTSFKNWATNFLGRQPGIKVECRERKPKSLPVCPACHKVIEYCPHAKCQKKIVATVEKGVDTLIATDMIRLAWENAYDLAVLATSDSDLVPAVEFLNLKGLKVIQAGFPPYGIDLAKASWGSFDVGGARSEIVRT